MKHWLITVLAIGTTSLLSAQAQFHRTYSTASDNHIVFDAVGSEGGNTYAVAGLQDDASGDLYDALLVTSFDDKGNVNYANVLYSEDSTEFTGVAAIARGFDGRLYVAGTVDRDIDNVLLFSMEDRNFMGEEAVTTYAIESNDTKATINRLSVAPDSTLLLATQRGSLDEVALLKITYDGELLWSRSISTSRSLDQVTALSMRPDSIASLSGTSGPDAWQLQVDSTGAVGFGRILSTTGSGELAIFDEYEVNDTVSCLVGSVTNSVLYAGFVALVDHSDSVLWARQTDFGDLMIASVLYHADLVDGTLRVFGESDGIESAFFALDIDLTDGQQRMQYVVDSADVLALNRPSGGLVVREEGYTYVGTTVRAGGLQHNHIRLDEMMSTGCSDTSMQEVLVPLVLSIDTLIADAQEDSRIDSVLTNGNAYQGYTHPVLSIRDTMVCGNLPFTKIFDASFLEDATAFMWTLPDGSESTDSAIVATEVGEYVVEVTMGADVCYTLCDTINIREFREPEVTIGRSLLGQCDIPPTNTLSLQQNIRAIPFSFVWEDGNLTDDSRIVVEEGVYSVTVTDACTLTAEAEVVVTFPPPLPESISFVDPGEYCDDGDLDLLVIDQDGAAINTAVYTFTFDGNVANNPREVAARDLICPDTYVATVSTACGTLTTEISLDGCLELPDSIRFLDPGEYCDSDEALVLSIVDENGDLVDQTGITLSIDADPIDNPLVIETTCDTTYQVMLSSDCGPTDLQAEIDIFACSCFRWPQLFFPNGVVNMNEGEVDNRIFAPINDKCDFIEDFELHIYNRWGNEVFEGSDFENGWNGFFDDAEAPQGVYVWWARYSSNGIEFTDRGNVTLLR